MLIGSPRARDGARGLEALRRVAAYFELASEHRLEHDREDRIERGEDLPREVWTCVGMGMYPIVKQIGCNAARET